MKNKKSKNKNKKKILSLNKNKNKNKMKLNYSKIKKFNLFKIVKMIYHYKINKWKILKK
jgi:hypothetical protein